MRILAILATLLLSIPAWAADRTPITPLSELPDDVASDFILMKVGTGLTVPGGVSGIVAAASPYDLGLSIPLGMWVAPSTLAIGPSLLMAGQARSMGRLKQRGVDVNRTAFLLGSISAGLGFAGGTGTVASLAFGMESDALGTFTPAGIGAGFHLLALIPFQVQAHTLRRAWTLELARNPQVEEDGISRGNKAFVVPAIDLVDRKVGVTVVW